MLAFVAAAFLILRKCRAHKKSEYEVGKNFSNNTTFAASTVAAVAELDDGPLSKSRQLDSIPKAELEARERTELEAINRA